MSRKNELEERILEEMKRIAFPEEYDWECPPKVSEQVRALEFLCRYTQMDQTQKAPQRLYVYLLEKKRKDDK